jgi:thiol-disulfide isomerase/thioredoxin
MVIDHVDDFDNWKGVNDSCVLSPKDMGELDSIAKNNDMVLFLHSHNCGHCKKALPVLEEECQKNDSQVKFVECPIENPHCRQVAQAAKVTGVPFTVGVPKGKNILNHDWKVVGARIPELKQKISGFKKKSNGGGSSGSRAPSPRAQAQQQAQPRPHPRPAPPPRISLDDAFLQLAGNGPGRGAMQFQAAPDPKYVEMCVPGKTCSHDEFEQRFVDFYSTDYL